MNPKIASLLLCLAALSACSALQKPPEPAMPSSRAERQPINKPVEDFGIARTRNADAGRVRRVSADGSQAPQEPVEQLRFPGTTRYVYGVSNAIVYCAVQHVCDIELQAGEKITQAPRIGDKSRWGVDLVMSGQAPNETPHLTLMPLEAGIETSLVVITNKRTYHLFLRSTQQHSMLHIAFTYPEDMAARWNALAPVAPAVSGK